MEEHRFKAREEKIRHAADIEGAGVEWHMSAHELNQGMTVGLREVKNKKDLPSFMLDYQFLDVSTARLHMMPGAGEDASTTEKLSRLALWAKAIQTYDSMMSPEVSKQLSIEEIQKLLQNNKIPRIEKIVAPTANPTLQTLLSRFSTFEQGKMGEMQVAWPELVEVAKQEKWV